MPIESYTLSQWAGQALVFASGHEIYDIERYAASLKPMPLSMDSRDSAYADFRADQMDTGHLYNFNDIHQHADFIELFYVQTGVGVAILNDTKRMIQKGDILCVHPGESHANYPLPQLKVCNCLVSAKLIRDNGPLFPPAIGPGGRLRLAPFNKLHGNCLLEVDALFQTMLQECEDQPLFYEDAMLTYLNQLLICLTRFEREDRTRGHYHRIIAPLLDYISDHYQTVTLGELAHFSSYNPTYLSKLFRQTLGVTFIEYVNKLRIDEAVKLITRTTMPIDEIAPMVGFKSRLHFYEVFKKQTGMTPGALRK